MLAVPAHAADSLETDYGMPVYWPQSVLTWAVVGEGIEPELVQFAAATWQAARCAHLRLRPARAGEVADIVVRVASGKWAYASDEAAWTAHKADQNTGEARQANIVLNPRWWRAPQVDQRALLVHEFGHALGLAHTIDRGTVMFGGLGRRTTLSDDDRAGVCAVFAKARQPAAPRPMQRGWLAALAPLAWLPLRAGRPRPASPGSGARRR